MQPQGQKGPQLTTAQKIGQLNEQVWLSIGKCDSIDYRASCLFFFLDSHDPRNADQFLIGSLTELMGDLDGAMSAYEQALRHNQWSIPAMSAISSILRTREQFPKAIEYLQNILKLDPNSGETWGSLGRLPPLGQ